MGCTASQSPLRCAIVDRLCRLRGRRLLTGGAAMSNNNVICLRRNKSGSAISRPPAEVNEFGHQQPFDQLTARLVLAKHERGELPISVVAALLAGVGLHP